MKEIILNCRFGGFGDFSPKAVKRYKELGGKLKFTKNKWSSSKNYYEVDSAEIPGSYMRFSVARFDPILIQVIKELGDEAVNDDCASAYRIDIIPDDFEYYISDYDGAESLELEPILRIDKLISLSNDKKALKEYLTKMKIKYID